MPTTPGDAAKVHDFSRMPPVRDTIVLTAAALRKTLIQKHGWDATLVDKRFEGATPPRIQVGEIMYVTQEKPK